MSEVSGGEVVRDSELYREAYNAHERAESLALEALYEHLRTVSTDGLACLCDPQWAWTKRSFLSDTIVDAADAILNERLDALVGAESYA